jgi:ubiquinone/menaquinone biosynthesis C-methylase UbiE
MVADGAWLRRGESTMTFGHDPSMRRPLAVLLLGLLVAAGAKGQPPRPIEADSETVPPALGYYKGRRIAQTMHYSGAPWLVRESRRREEDTATMIKQLKLRPGMTVCDMGCGNGFYALQMAKMVGPGGKVLAVDIQTEMLRLLQRRAKQAAVENIVPIRGSVVDPNLPKGKVDLILCVDVYHEFSHPEQMLAAMRQALAPQGRLVLVEFREEDPSVPIKPLHKMSKRQILKELTPNGLKLVDQFDQLPWQHMMFFARDGDAALRCRLPLGYASPSCTRTSFSRPSRMMVTSTVSPGFFFSTTDSSSSRVRTGTPLTATMMSAWLRSIPVPS